MNERYFSYLVVSPDKSKWVSGVTTNPPRFMDDYQNAFNEKGNMPQQQDRMVYAEKFNYQAAANQRAKELEALSNQEKQSLVEQFNPDWKDVSFDDRFNPNTWQSTEELVIPDK